MANDINIFIKKVWGLHPPSWPVVSCAFKRSAEYLIEQANIGDLILHVVSEKIGGDQRGLVIGLVEFEPKIVNTEDFIAKHHLDIKQSPHNFSETGDFKWKYSVPILRAWKFHEAIPYRQILEKHKSQYDGQTRSGYAKLYPEDVETVLALKRDEISFDRKMSSEENMQNINESIVPKSSTPSRSISPSSYSGEIHRNFEGPGFTYALRFGNREHWKIGYSKNLENRLKEINAHIPYEILQEQWNIFSSHKWNSAKEAFAMEQEVFKLLDGNSFYGERVACSKDDIETAWQEAKSKLS